MESLKANFALALIYGCLFHLAKNMKKHVSHLGLLRRYNNEAEFSLQARMIVALAFVPIDRLEEYFNALSEYLPAELVPLLAWFEQNYMGM